MPSGIRQTPPRCIQTNAGRRGSCLPVAASGSQKEHADAVLAALPLFGVLRRTGFGAGGVEAAMQHGHGIGLHALVLEGQRFGAGHARVAAPAMGRVEAQILLVADLARRREVAQARRYEIRRVEWCGIRKGRGGMCRRGLRMATVRRKLMTRWPEHIVLIVAPPPIPAGIGTGERFEVFLVVVRGQPVFVMHGEAAVGIRRAGAAAQQPRRRLDLDAGDGLPAALGRSTLASSPCPSWTSSERRSSEYAEPWPNNPFRPGGSTLFFGRAAVDARRAFLQPGLRRPDRSIA